MESCKDLLRAFSSGDIVNIEDVEELVTRMRKQSEEKRYLEKHTYKLYEGKDGRWYTRFPLKNGGSKQRAFRSFADAEKAIIEFYKDSDDICTIHEVFESSQKAKLEEESISMATYTRNRTDFNRFYGDVKDINVNDISESWIENFIRKQKVKHKLNAHGYANLLTITRTIFKYAKKKGLVAFRIDDILDDIDWGKNAFRYEEDGTDEEEFSEVFTDDEIIKLVNYFVRNPNGKTYGLWLSFLTGLRVGELSALKWNDILEDVILVRRTETSFSVAGKLVCEVKNSTKTNAGKRRVPIPSQGRWIIEELKKLNPNGEYVFMYRGSRTRAVYFRKALYKACDAVGIPRRSPHKIRKTYASILLDNNLSTKLITENMGHVDILTTNKSYAKARKRDKEKAAIVSDIFEFNTLCAVKK